jgi:hypothetical protein
VDDLKTNKILWIASGYALAVAALYLWGYWERFGLNFLEYIGFGDMLRYALIPFLISMAGVVLGLALSTITHCPRSGTAIDFRPAEGLIPLSDDSVENIGDRW